MRKVGHQTGEPQGLTQGFRDSWVPGMANNQAVKHSSKARPWCSHTNCRGPSSSQCGCYVPCQCPRRHYWSATSVWPPGEWSCCRLWRGRGHWAGTGEVNSALEVGSSICIPIPLQPPLSPQCCYLKFMSSRLTDCSLGTRNVWRWSCWQSKVSFITKLEIYAYIMFQKINLSTGTATSMKMAARSHPQGSYNMP